ncbi:MAG TPA: aminotransferase class III-fold pyridoxal phosphate-dependent enzyme [Longimicrobiales bacterium]|nr:aminotransferase class III-fold pyridoxal phosphate-dependent enzyme [Longimicrobiales bacterium]
MSLRLDEIDVALAEEAVREMWGERVEARPLPGDVDRNFVLVDDDGRRSVLKFVARATPTAALELQAAALARFIERVASTNDSEGHEAEVRVPRILPTTSGETLPEYRGVRTRRLSWVSGTPMAEVVPSRLQPSPATDRFMWRIGRFVGRATSALRGFDHPVGAVRHRWDPFAVEWIEEGAARLHVGRRGALIGRVLDLHRSVVAPRVDGLPHGVIHADANDHNLLVDAESWERGPVGLIDFGDVMRTARVCDAAIAAAYAAMRSGDPASAIAEVAAGWRWAIEREGDDVREVEMMLLPALVRSRLAISVTVSASRSSERSGDAYVTVSEAPAWRLLEALDHLGHERMVDVVLERCGAGCPRRGPRSGEGHETAVARPRALEAAPPLVERRGRVMGPNLSLSYAEPIHAVRGWMQYLYDAEGNAWIDAYNNVPHVGHAHPHVADAIARQTSLLATNTRYLSQVRLDYLERLADRFPDPLDRVYLVNSASEANELALRIARAATGRRDLVVQDVAYHGHTTTLVDVSPYKAEGPGGEGVPDWVHVAALPDPYRGRHRSGRDAVPGERYAADLRSLLDTLEAEGRPPGAFIAETFPSVGGQIVPPDGYLEGAFAAARDVGALVIADEVQTGFGRLGSVDWGFQVADVVPDIVVLGKPMGNGFPMAAVVTTRELAEAFDTGMEYFSTFGGNPVACAAGDAVLDVLDAERLPDRADRVGARLLDGIRALGARHEAIGDVRGLGLFIGIDLVSDRETRTADAARARRVVEGLRRRGVLAGTDGREHNVVKLRGPLVMTEENADRIVAGLDGALEEAAATGRASNEEVG